MSVSDSTMTMSELASQFKVGNSIDLDLTSFTSSKDVARSYARTKSDSDHRVIMNLVDARGIAIKPEATWDEHLVSGRAVVERYEARDAVPIEVWLRYVK